MKYFLGLLTILITGCKAAPESLPDAVASSLSSVKTKYAPDKRIAIFDIKAEKTSQGIILRGETNISASKKDLLDSLKQFKIIDSIVCLPSLELEGKIYAVVTISVANMRSAPGHSAELSNQLLCGTVLRVYKTKNDWYYVQSPDDYLGWLDGLAMQLMDSIEINKWYQAAKIISLTDQSYLYAQASLASDKLTNLPQGCILKWNADNVSKLSFYSVSLPDGRSGFIPISQAEPFNEWKANKKEIPSAAQIFHAAQSLMGRPYLWGGTSINGMDCSGFTKLVYYFNGLQLPRDASQQVKVGLSIPADTSLQSLLPGDFLFFGSQATETTKERISHVAIYLGQGKIIHASGYVRIRSMRRGDPDFDEMRLNSFIRATRPLHSPKENGILSIGENKFYQ